MSLKFIPLLLLSSALMLLVGACGGGSQPPPDISSTVEAKLSGLNLEARIDTMGEDKLAAI